MFEIDTTPGASGPFAPPSGWDGSAEAYRALLRDRYRGNVAARQQMGIVAMRPALACFSGPWADEARAVVDAIAEKEKSA